MIFRARRATRWIWRSPPNQLKPIPKDHILARKATDLEAVRHLAAHHLELIKLVLNSFGGKATADQIQAVLVPDVIRDDWKKWWETAKREMKKDGHFIVPSKKTEPVVYQAKETSLQDRLLADFRAAKGLKARILVVAEVIKVASDLTDKTAAATEIIAALNADIASYQRTQPAVALEAIFARDELREAAGLPAGRRAKSPPRKSGAQEHQVRPAAGSDSRRQTSPRAGVVQAGQSRHAGRKSCAAR